MSRWWIPGGAARRHAFTALVALGALGSLQWAANAAHPLVTLRHLGPVGLVSGQEAIVTVANTTSAAIRTIVTLFDANAHVLEMQHVTVPPHSSEAVRWPAPSETRVRATVTTPGIQAFRYPIAMFLYDAGSQDPALAAQVNDVQSAPPSTPHASLSPYAPLLVVAKNVVSVVNLGPVTSTFTVSFFDCDGGLVSAQTLALAPLRTGVAEVPPQPNGVRSEVQAPPGTPFLVSSEVVDEATGRTMVVLLAP